MGNFFKTIKNTVRYWYMPLITGIIFILVGIFVFVTPLESYLTLSVFFSISFLVSGIFEVFFAVSNRKEMDNWGWFLVSGIFYLLTGIILVMNPEISITILPLFIGFTILFSSIHAIGIAYDLKNYGIMDWGNLAIIGFLGLLFSFFLIWNPVFTGISLIVWTGLAFVSIGIFGIYVSVKLKKLKDIPNKISDDLKKRYEDLKEEFQKAIQLNK